MSNVNEQMMEQMKEHVEMINPVTFQSEELRMQARLDAVGGNPNKLNKGYIILIQFHDESKEWMKVDNREQLRQTIIDLLKSADDNGMTIDVDNSYVLPEGWTVSFNEDWSTVYDVMKHIEQYFTDSIYEPFDIEDYV